MPEFKRCNGKKHYKIQVPEDILCFLPEEPCFREEKVFLVMKLYLGKVL